MSMTGQCDRPHVLLDFASPPASLLMKVEEEVVVPSSSSSSSSSTMMIPHSLLFTNDDRITSLERSVCSNFLCCGENLADFHALIEHFEENHVSVVSSSGKKLYPKQKNLSINTSVPSTPSSTASTPASSRSSSVVPSPPMPVTPLSPSQSSQFIDGVEIVSHDPSPPPLAPHLPASQSLPVIEYNPYIGIITPTANSEATSPLALPPKGKPISIEVISAFGPEYDFARDYARYEEAWRRKSAEAEASQAQAQLERELREAEEEEMERMGFSLSRAYDDELGLDSLGLDAMVSMPVDPISVAYSPSASHPSTSRSTSQPPLTNNGGKVPKSSRARPTSSSPTSSIPLPASIAASSSLPLPGRPKVTIPTIPNAPPVSLGKKRDKAYKCPHWGCMKAYLNPNGLKYHLEKGTCKFEEGKRGFVRSAVTTPTMPEMEVDEERRATVQAAAEVPSSQPWTTPSPI